MRREKNERNELRNIDGGGYRFQVESGGASMNGDNESEVLGWSENEHELAFFGIVVFQHYHYQTILSYPIQKQARFSRLAILAEK